MRAFAGLYEALDRTTSTNAKIAALVAYFRAAPPADAAWALYFLTGRKLKRLIPSRVLWELAQRITGVPEWLLEHCYAAVGDFAELLALLLDETTADAPAPAERSLEAWVRERILSLRGLDQQAESLQRSWAELRPSERLVFNKLITGEFRVGVSATLVVRALAQLAGVTQPVMAHRLMGDWQPTPEFFRNAMRSEAEGGSAADAVARPYPFFLASPLEGDPAALGRRAEWLAEWKWDGIRAQLVRRGGETFLWSRGEELIGERFPEIMAAATRLPAGSVLDGEVLAFRERVLPFAVLQTRIGRKRLTPDVLAGAPAAFMSYDVLEQDGLDIRPLTLAERRARLETLLGGMSGVLRVSEIVAGETWEDLARIRTESRARQVEGLMLKRLSSAYQSGRRRGDWWKWKIAPYTVDTVMIYAHPGHGKRASLFTDYTFGVWHEGQLVPVARAYSGLDDHEIRELDGWVRRHTRERFGPTRAVEPSQVFELAFEGIAPSGRHRSGVAVRFPRILRWRKDKPAAEADSLATLQALLRVDPAVR